MRSYLGLNQIDLVLGELNENDAIYWLAIYLKEGSTSLDKCLEGLNNISPPSIISSIIQGIIYTNENDIKNAMKLFYSCISTSLEAYSHYISLLLKMDRHDIALKEVNKMKSIDEDSTLTLLSEAWVILSGSSGNNNNNNSNSNSNSNLWVSKVDKELGGNYIDLDHRSFFVRGSGVKDILGGDASISGLSMSYAKGTKRIDDEPFRNVSEERSDVVVYRTRINIVINF